MLNGKSWKIRQRPKIKRSGHRWRDGVAGIKEGVMIMGLDLIKMVVAIFEKGEFPDESIKERHLSQFSSFQNIGDGKYEFSIIRHPTCFTSMQFRKEGLISYKEVHCIFELDTKNEKIISKNEKIIGVHFDYDQIAQSEADATIYSYYPDFDNIHSKKEMEKFAKAESENLNFGELIEAEIDDIKNSYPEFEFDLDLYLGKVKACYALELISKWENVSQ